MRNKIIAVVAAFAGIAGAGCGGSMADATDAQRRATEKARVEALCREAQPEVAKLTGFAEGDAVEILITDQDELRRFLVDTVDLEYPTRELDRRGRCFAEIGLLPPGYDLRKGMIELVEEQAGGLYDPYAKALRWIAGLPNAGADDLGQRLVVAHELAHALQDRSLDLVERFKAAQGDLDSGFGFVAVMEGTAMVAGMAYARDMTTSQLGDIGPFLRSGYMSGNARMPAFARSPVYVQEVMIGPYVEGSTFVHEYLAANPEATMASLFDRLPATSEQTLHYEKYIEPDLPIAVNLSAATSMLPAEWSEVYTNTLGEFEVRTMCRNHAAFRVDADEIAAGWDGFRVAAYDDGHGEMVVVGASCWDTASDAEEFERAFRAILAGVHGDDAFEVRRLGDRVGLVTGLPDGSLRRTLLDQLTRRGPGYRRARLSDIRAAGGDSRENPSSRTDVPLR